MNFTIKQTNTSPILGAQLKDANSDPVDLTGATVVFNMADINDRVVVNGAACTVTDEENGRVQYEWQTGDTARNGIYHGEFKVTYSDGSIESFPNSEYLSINVVADVV